MLVTKRTQVAGASRAQTPTCRPLSYRPASGRLSHASLRIPGGWRRRPCTPPAMIGLSRSGSPPSALTPPPPRKQRNRRVPWPVPATHCDVTAGPTDARRSIAAAGGTGDAPAEVGAEARHRVVRLQWGAARVGHPRAGTRHSPVGCGAEAGVARWRARPPPTTLTPDHTHHPRPRPTASGR